MTSPITDDFLRRTTALRTLARALVGDDFADDIVQETAIQAMTVTLRRPGSVGGWLTTVVRYLASKHRRAERIRHLHEAQAARAASEPTERSATDADTLGQLTKIVTALPEPYRGTILARYLRGETPSEIAANTNTPVRTVKTRLQRGLALLRERLGEHDGGLGSDWRAGLAAAFALDLTITTKPILISTPMKLTLVAVILLPLGFAIWTNFRDTSVQDASPAPVETAMGSRRPVAHAEVPRPETTTDRRGVRDAEPSDQGTVVPGPVASVATPADAPLMRLDIAGPAAFRAAFQNTNLGALMASAPGEKMWRPLLAPLDQTWRLWDGGGDKFGETRRRVLDYAGRIRVLWMVQPGGDQGQDRVFGVFALYADGATPLAALAGDLSRAMRAFVPVEPKDRTVGDHKLRVLGDPDSGFVTLPMLMGGNLVGLFGNAGSLGRIVPRCLRALAQDAGESSAPLSLHIDLAQLQRLSGARTDPVLVKLFGLESLRSLRATVCPDGEHAACELEVDLGDGPLGMLAGFFPAVETLPKLLARVPATATPWLTVAFRPDVAFRAVLAAAAETEKGGIEGVREAMHEKLGVHIDTELLDHLSGEVMVLGDLWQAEDRKVVHRGDDPPFGACVAMSLGDTAAFSRGFDKLLGHLKGVVHRYETREVDGVKITRLGSAFLTGLHMAMGKGLFAVAIGKEGVAQLEALVAGGEKGKGVAQEPRPAIERARHLAPAGFNGLGLTSLAALLGGQATITIEMINEALPREMRIKDFQFDAMQDRFDKLLPLVTKHDLENIVLMTGRKDTHWRLRVVW